MAQRISFALLSPLGITFWFVLGFPFANHNESYEWLARFKGLSAWDAWTSHVVAATFRPVGQGLAHTAWLLTGPDSSLVQLFNFAVAAVAISAIAFVMPETRAFALTAALATAVCFSGYIYLFHLHGIFYSPIIALIPALLYFDQTEGLGQATAQLLSFVLAVAIGLSFHPYALILFLAFLVGTAIEKRKSASRRDWIRITILMLAIVVTLHANRPEGHALSQNNLSAMLASYALTELSPLVSVFVVVCAVATILSTERLRWTSRLLLSLALAVMSAMLVRTAIPLILLWIAMAALKMLILGRCSIAGMIAAAALLPGIAPSGSPTYAVFPVLLAVIALVWGWNRLERVLRVLDHRMLSGAAIAALVLALTIRTGVEVPIVSKLAQPLMAERERTNQLETIIEWILTSEHRSARIILEHIANPSNNIVEARHRDTRPPTYQRYLNVYLDSRRTTKQADSVSDLLVTFGGFQGGPDMKLVKAVPGRFAGAAHVYSR
jgi:hypothetical protein